LEYARPVPPSVGGTALTPNRVFAGRFEVERAVTSGGMGAIYRAVDRVSGKRVALKLILGSPEDAGERFAREGRVLASLSHPAIVRYVAHGTTPEGEPFLAMEWLEGEDLASRLARGALPMGDAIALVQRAAEALGAAHAAGITHRDIKPSNLFLEGGSVDGLRVVDFGIARAPGTRFTATGMAMGTPGYMAPEQVSSSKEVGPRADVFALGCVLFECVAGRPAFAAQHVMALLAKLLFEEAPRLGDTGEYPTWLCTLVARMLAKNPADRYADGAEVAAEMTRHSVAVSQPASAAADRRLTVDEMAIASVVFASSPSAAPAPTMLAGLADAPLANALRLEGRVVLSQGLRASIEAQGGELEALPDGSVVVVVRRSATATDRAAQAARCALALRAELRDASISIATGRGTVVTRSDHHGRAFGEAVDRAVALLAVDAREHRAIVIDDVTAGLLDTRFEVCSTPHGLVLEGERAIAEEVRTLLGKPTSCVGRDRELARLADHFDDCVREERAAAVLVTAPPGVGKSRLRYELVRRLRSSAHPPEMWIARCDPLRSAVPFAVVGSLVAKAAGMPEGAAAGERVRQLEHGLGRLLEGETLTRATAFLGELVDAPLPSGDNPELDAARRDAKLLGGQLRRAWESLVRGGTRSRPLLIVIEDLHWADATSVDFLQETLRALWDRPWMLLAFARPEVREGHPTLFEAKATHEVRLGALGRSASEALVREVLGERIDAESVARIVERAEGNAFYLEELVRAVAKHVDEGGAKDDLRAWATSALPETVLAMVEARLARLPAEARRVLRAASILGERFWRGAIAALVGGDAAMLDVDAWLERLAADEVVAARGESKFSNEREYAFRHALLRDGSYAMLSEADRTLGHRLAGAWLESAGEPDAAVVAAHFEQGMDRERAADWFHRAASQAVARNEFRAAVAAADRAQELGAAGDLLGRIHGTRGRAHASTARWREARADFERALELLSPERLELRVELLLAHAIACHWLADGDAIARSATEASELADRLGLEDLRVEAMAARSFAFSHLNRMAEGLEAVRGVGTVWRRSSITVAMASHMFHLTGESAEGMEQLARCRDAARRASDWATLTIALQGFAVCAGSLGHMGEAERSIEEAIAVARLHRLDPYLARATSMAAGLAFDAFDLDRAEQRSASALEIARAAAFVPGIMMSSIDRARFALHRGRLDEVTEFLANAESIVPRSGSHAPLGALRSRTVRAEYALARGDHEEALRIADEAIALSGPLMRRKYEVYGRIARASAFAGLGRNSDSRDELSRAIELIDGLNHPSLFVRAFVQVPIAAADPALRTRAREAVRRMASSFEGDARTNFEATPMVRAAMKD